MRELAEELGSTTIIRSQGGKVDLIPKKMTMKFINILLESRF